MTRKREVTLHLSAIDRCLIYIRIPLALLYGLVLLGCVTLLTLFSPAWLAAFFIGLCAQLLFISITGDLALPGPAPRGRIWVCAGVAGIMMAGLGAALGMASSEILPRSLLPDLCMLLLAGLGLLTTPVFRLVVGNLPRYRALRRMIRVLLVAGVLVPAADFFFGTEVAIPGHGGDIPGLPTAIGTAVALALLVWALGPAIALLFVAKRLQPEKGFCPACGYNLTGLPEMRCPECGRAFTMDEAAGATDVADTTTGAPPRRW